MAKTWDDMTDLNSSPNSNVLKFLPSNYRVSDELFLGRLIQGINGSNERLEQLVRACIDQLFLSSAQGRYLIQLGEQSGFVMPSSSGLDIRAYRTLVPIMVADPKQVRQTIEEIVRAFYLSERVRPNLVSSITDPYQLLDGDSLIIETQSGRVQVSITANQVNDLNNVSAAEIAAIINSSQNEVLADTPIDRTSARNFLRVTSAAGGTSANIRIAGGTLQNLLKFPLVIETKNQAGTALTLTKTSPYTDELRVTWDGVGYNPLFYKVKRNDIVTIRGLTDGAYPLSLLNGSYEIVDSGYDYFIIKNGAFSTLSASVSLPSDNSIVFTDGRRSTIYDRDEFALVSESDVNTLTVTVPAIPPLARRFLVGAMHLRGAPLEVVDFSRTSIQVRLGTGIQKPDGDNWFRLVSDTSRFNFREKSYKTTSVNLNDTEPTYTVASGDPEYAVLPFTTPSITGINNPIYGEVDSAEYKLSFTYDHGLKFPWSFTMAGATGAGNIVTTDLNRPLYVYSVDDSKTLKFRIFNPDGTTKTFSGFSWGPADLKQFSTTQLDGSDFYLEFPNASAAIASGLIAGMSCKLDVVGGIDANPYVAGILRYQKMTVVDVSSNIVKISTGYGIGPFGLIISAATGKRSGEFGGNAITQYLDKTITHNKKVVLEGLKALIYGYTKPQNPAFTNSYMYDPSGEATKVTVSKYIVKSSKKIFKGDNIPFIEIAQTQTTEGDELPQSGSIVLGFGSNSFEGPINYYAVIKNPGNNQILIDPAYKFKNTHNIGTQVQLIHKALPFSPGIDGDDFPTYLTGTVSARETMFLLIELLVAAGIFVEKEVIKPDLRYNDSGVTVFD